MKSSMIKSVVQGLGISLWLAAQAARAADAAAPASAPAAGMGMAACMTDFQKICPGTKPGNGAVKTCLKEHKDQVSPECKKEIMEARRKARSTQ